MIARMEISVFCFVIVPLANENLQFLPEEWRSMMTSFRIGDRASSDVVVRLRTDEGRDDWFYCHSQVLTAKSKYFADRLSNDWPTCQILDSRDCVDVHCSETEFNFHVNVLRLLYVTELDTWDGVRNTLGILQVADRLGCYQLAHACVDYLEAVPWDEIEEEEILKAVPCLGVHYQKILARLHPVDSAATASLVISAVHFATTLQSVSLHELKRSAQEQLEYLLTEDDDSPLFTTNDASIMSEVKKCTNDLLGRFDAMIKSLSSTPPDKTFDLQAFQSILADLSWVCQILVKLEMMKDLVLYWVETSVHIINAIQHLDPGAGALMSKLKLVEIAFKVLDTMSCGHVIIPATQRAHMVKVWLPFVQETRPMADAVDVDGDITSLQVDCELWQSLESAFVSVLLTLPSGEVAAILANWLRSEHVRYPDLTEAFEVWCYRSKAAKKKFGLPSGINNFSK